MTARITTHGSSDNGHVAAQCDAPECRDANGRPWIQMHPSRTIEGRRLAERDAKAHNAARHPVTSPSAVSARLKRAGFTTVATRKLEGIRVSRGILGSVSIEVDHDTPRSEARVADLLATELATWADHDVRRTQGGNHFYVTRKPTK